MSDGSGQEQARVDRTAGSQRWRGAGPEREDGRSLRPLLGLMPYVKKQRTTVILAIIFLALSSGLNLAITFPARFLGDAGFSTLNADAVNAGFMAMIGVALALGVTSAILFYFFSRFGE